MRTIWIIHWRYTRGGGCGIIERAFSDEDDARYEAQRLCRYADGKLFSLHSLELADDDEECVRSPGVDYHTVPSAEWRRLFSGKT